MTIPKDLMTAFNRVAGLVGRAGFAVLVILAAGVAVFASAVIGLIVAVAAIGLRIAAGRARRRRGGPTAHAADARTLDAHRTAKGWVVEAGAR